MTSPVPPALRRRHPIVTTLLTIFTLLSLGLILAMVLSGLIWTPWLVHAFQATNDEELTGHYAAIVFSIVLGIPAAILGLTCGHFALWLAWPDPPLRTAGSTSSSSDKTGRNARTSWATRLVERATAAGAGRAILLGVLLVCLVFGYLSILLQGGYLVWRLLFQEYL